MKMSKETPKETPKKATTKMQFVLAMVVVLQACTTISSNSNNITLVGDQRPLNWATPIQLPALYEQNNLFKVSDALYRAEQPSAQFLAALDLPQPDAQVPAINSIVMLRRFHNDQTLYQPKRILYHRIPMLTWSVNDTQVVDFLNWVRQKEHQPVLLHCQHGADRTGLMVAMYRIVEQNWSKEQAIKEMVQGGYGYHGVWRNIIDYIERVDVDAIRRQLK